MNCIDIEVYYFCIFTYSAGSQIRSHARLDLMSTMKVVMAEGRDLEDNFNKLDCVVVTMCHSMSNHPMGYTQF